MSEFQEYPKMLYRPAKGEGKGEMICNERVDTTIVHSNKKEFEAIKEGWLLEPTKACAISAKMKKRSLFLNGSSVTGKFGLLLLLQSQP